MRQERSLVWAAVAPSLLVLVVVGMAVAGSVTIPNTFTPNTVADANQVNDNFTAVRNAVNDNDTRITALEATPGQIRGFARIEGDAVTPTIANSWMANGGTPTVTRTGLGTYRINFPGESVNTFGTNRCILASAAFTTGFVAVSGLSPDVFIRIYDTAGAATDGDFWVMITGEP